MQINLKQGKVLGEALLWLGRGDPRRFDDILWLGFGDDCQRMWSALVEGRYVEAGGCVFDTRITPRGMQLLRRLSSM